MDIHQTQILVAGRFVCAKLCDVQPAQLDQVRYWAWKRGDKGGHWARSCEVLGILPFARAKGPILSLC